MSHTIAAAAKMTVQAISSDLASAHTDLQTALRALAAGDDVVSIDMVRDNNSNSVMIYLTFEDQ
tara:strand:- start:491 stop:682 length:192 start_codon:yes stop_codon:yes gene_type:complete